MSTKATCVFIILFAIFVYKTSTQYRYPRYGEIEYTPKSNLGDQCEWEGRNGTCVDFWTCFANVFDVVVHGIHPPLCRIEAGKVFSCCTGCDLVANISSVVILPEFGRMYVKDGRRARDKCLDYMKQFTYPCYKYFFPGKVVKEYNDIYKCNAVSLTLWGAAGGKDARRSEFPHMALLGYGEEQEAASWLCGGTVISDRFILTAGHCRSSSQLGEVRFIALGILKRSDPPSLWQVYRVDSFIAHPEYRPPSKYHDIALIRTDSQIRLGGSVLPACLTIGDETLDNGDATGWGSLGHRQGLADVLQKVTVKAFSSEKCSEQYVPHRSMTAGYNHTTQMCYGDADAGKDTCEGDSGGPLQLEECPHVVFGVTSSGHPCGFAGGAGLYTRVTFYVPWIETVVWP